MSLLTVQQVHTRTSVASTLEALGNTGMNETGVSPPAVPGLETDAKLKALH
jgi:hypothetical protein